MKRLLHSGLLLAGLLAALGAPRPGVAQSPLPESETTYEAILAEYTALAADLQRIFSLHEQALDAVDMARRSGDEGRQERALATFRSRAIELMELERSVEQAAGRLREARRELLYALDEREAQLLEEIEETEESVGRVRLEQEWERIRRRALQVEAEVELEEEIALQPVPELTVDPRDGPAELREKAGFLEERAAAYDSVVADLTTEIADRERQIQRLRGREDLLADLARFDTDLSPGGRLGPRSPTAAEWEDGGGEGSDVALTRLPLPEQVEILRGVREQALQYRDRALAQSEVFRERAERFP